jgi:hypothetical protein
MRWKAFRPGVVLEQAQMAGPGPVRGPLSSRVARLGGPAVFLLADALGKDAEDWPKSIRHRYGSGHVVSRSIRRATDDPPLPRRVGVGRPRLRHAVNYWLPSLRV